LYLGIEYSINFEFAKAKHIFNTYSDKNGIKDIRHLLHKVEINLFKVLITGKKSLIDKSLIKISRLE
jgi:hypothetical protein